MDFRYKTVEMGEATALHIAGYDIIGFEKNPERFGQVYFVFEKTPELEETVKEYWRGEFTVDAKMFWNEQKNLRRLLKAEAGV